MTPGRSRSASNAPLPNSPAVLLWSLMSSEKDNASGSPGEVTQLLSRLRGGDACAQDELMSLVYDELRYLARGIFQGNPAARTLQPTALVHEAWLKISRNMKSLQDRGHFLVVAGMAMRQVIADYARSAGAGKRFGGVQRITLGPELLPVGQAKGVDMIVLNDLLLKLSKFNARLAHVAEIRLFSGLSIDETAELMGISARSVDSDWALSKAWLRKELAAN